MMLAVRFVFVFGALFNLLSADDGITNKFTYDRKLLDKMIRLEIKMEQMEKEMKLTEENVRLFTQNQTKWLENRTVELQLLEGRIDTPLIAFSAYSPTDVSPDTNQVFIWQSVRLNEGNAYDVVTGIFHAPVSGLYYFAVHVCNYSSQTVQYAIVLEENIIARSYKYDNENTDCGSMNTVTMVTEGQRVWVKCTSGSPSSNQIWESSGRSSFVGALMHKTVG